ncbi:hypothetical protein [Beijerinckia sp. L45]|uniref:hypothetical protein n=1 Tax=Beijerinckia sp. L45 TaxID=1641855 RepID=UPI00131D65A2|nr:hypothetical protein [Beijerinckia sp. L45]
MRHRSLRFRAAVAEAREARAALPEPARYESGASIALRHAADALAAAHRAVADAGLPINGVDIAKALSNSSFSASLQRPLTTPSPSAADCWTR